MADKKKQEEQGPAPRMMPGGPLVTLTGDLSAQLGFLIAQWQDEQKLQELPKKCEGPCSGQAVVYVTSDLSINEPLDEIPKADRDELMDAAKQLAAKQAQKLKDKAKKNADRQCELAGGAGCKCEGGEYKEITDIGHFWTGVYAYSGWRYKGGTCKK